MTRVSYEMSDLKKDGLHASDHFTHVNPADAQAFDPDESKRISKDGAWVMITRRLPPIEGSFDEKIRVGRIFYVVHSRDADDAGFCPNGRYKVLLQSPWGDLGLWPYEYSVMPTDTIIALWGDGEVIFHPTNLSNAAFNDIVFYARSRGIGLANAAVMALGTLKGNVGWFEPRPDLAPTLEAMEERVHRWCPRNRVVGRAKKR